MTPRPLHKWKTLWLGLIILASLTWAWSRSLDHGDWVNVSVSSTKTWSLTSGRGYIGWFSQGYPPAWAPPDRVSFESHVFSDRWNWFQPPFRQRNEDIRPGFPVIHVGIAYWLITLLFLLPWTILLHSRWRKGKFLTAPPTGSTP